VSDNFRQIANFCLKKSGSGNVLPEVVGRGSAGLPASLLFNKKTEERGAVAKTRQKQQKTRQPGAGTQRVPLKNDYANLCGMKSTIFTSSCCSRPGFTGLQEKGMLASVRPCRAGYLPGLKLSATGRLGRRWCLLRRKVVPGRAIL
jgi:hypothetical protein